MVSMMGVLQVLGGLLVIAWWQPVKSIQPSDITALQQRISEILAYVVAANRSQFYKSCIGTIFTCNKQSFAPKVGFFHWRPGITPAEQERFWQTYRCIVKLKLPLCPVDGEWSLWTTWTSCSSPCQDVGNMTRDRLCNNPLPMHKGRHCIGIHTDVETCTGSCPGSIGSSGFKEAGEAVKAVHQVFPRLKAECLHGHCDYEEIAKYLDNTRRDRYWSHLMCYKHKRACPVDGGWTIWGEWSNCSVPCGNGYQYRHRTCSSPTPINGGQQCQGTPTEQLPCVSKTCQHIKGNERAIFTGWSDFTPCSASCGSYGYQESKRTCLMSKNCVVSNDIVNTLTIKKPCYTGACPQTGGWSQWSEWTECSAISGDGRKTRLRLCSSPYPSGGASCVGPQVDATDCKQNASSTQLSLPQEGVKESSTQSFTSKEAPPRGDPYSTPYDTSKEGQYLPWSNWTSCSYSCGGGYRARQRECIKNKKDLLKTCDGEIQQIQFCNVFICPEKGGWSDWTAWSVCGATCNNGIRHRYRRCDNPLPMNGGVCPGASSALQACNAGPCIQTNNHWSEWTSWSGCSKSCGGGEMSRTREWQGKGGNDTQTMTGFCSAHACDAPGKWAMWGEWTPCSSSCNLGHHYRDRTCTDPAPVNNGKTCPGQGTEAAYCYKGPCKEDEPAIVFSGPSYLTYSSHVKHTRYLLLYLRLKPISPGGTLLYRYRGCKEGTWECTHVITLNVDGKWRPHLKVAIEGQVVQLSAGDLLKDSAWNDIQVGIFRQLAYIRVNDGEHSTVIFEPPLEQEMDFDANMAVGAEKNGTKGFNGIISILRVNFKEQALMQSPYWLGPGAPDRQVMVTQYNASDTSLNYPDFRSHHYARLGFKHDQLLKLMLTLRLLGSDGLILYNEGEITGSHVSLSVDKGALKLCFACGESDSVCEEGSLLQLTNWYYLTLKVEGTEASLRVNRGSALQATCLGRQYRPLKEVFLAGVPSEIWKDLTEVTGITKGYDGNFDVVVVNGEKFSFRRGGLFNFDDRINSMGYSLAAHVSEVVEHTSSKVTLRCDFTNFTTGEHQATSHWLMGDVFLNSTEGAQIISRLPGYHNESSLTLMPEEHQEGLYACLVDQEGRLLLTHAFPLFRVRLPLIVKATTEWSIIIGLLVFVVIIFIITITILVVKRDTLQQLKKSSTYSDDLEDSLDTPDMVDMDDLSVIHEELEDQMSGEEEEELANDEDREQLYQVADIDTEPGSDGEEEEGEGGEEEEGEEPEDGKEEERQEGEAQGESDISRLGSVVAAKLIEENKDKVLELIASLGSLDNFHEVSSKLSQRLSAASAGHLRGVPSSANESPSSVPSSRTSITQHNINASAVRNKSLLRSSQNWTQPVTPNIEMRRSLSRSTSGSPPHSPPLEVRRSISRPSSRSPSPSRRGSTLQPSSPRSLSMSISPTTGPDVRLPMHIQPPLRVKVFPKSSHSDQDQPQLSLSESSSHPGLPMFPQVSGIYPMRPPGLFRPPIGALNYSGLPLGLSGPPRQPFGPIQLSDIKAKVKDQSREPEEEGEEDELPYLPLPPASTPPSTPEPPTPPPF